MSLVSYASAWKYSIIIICIIVEDGREAEAARGGDRWFVYRRH